MDKPSHAPDLHDCTLVLVGHGSKYNSESSLPTYRHAAKIRSRNLFADVREAFLKEEPSLSEVLTSLRTSDAYVVPVLAYKGFIAGEMIPRELERASTAGKADKTGRRPYYLCDPVGTHPLVTEAMAAQVGGMIFRYGLDAGNTCVLLVGHGSIRSLESKKQTNALAVRLAANCDVASVHTAFIEQDPRIGEWTTFTTAKTVIVMPFLMSGGLHGAEDVPALLGLDPADERLRLLTEEAQAAGPFETRGRKLLYCRAVGNEPVIADIILERVEVRFNTKSR